MTRLVCGVGVNDSHKPVFWIENGRKVRCKFYTTWLSMLERCYSQVKQASRPSYIGCYVASEWHSFSAFKEWMSGQPWEGRELDKDILFPGNKMYGPDTCVFVSPSLNSFLTNSKSSGRGLPVGVRNIKGKFIAKCSNPFNGKVETIGRFSTPIEAHEAWRARKKHHASAYAAMQTDERIASALLALHFD